MALRLTSKTLGYIARWLCHDHPLERVRSIVCQATLKLTPLALRSMRYFPVSIGRNP